MRARQFNRRVEIWQTREVKDGFGGIKMYDEPITKSWACIKTHKDGSKDTEVGVVGYSEKIDVILRQRNDIEYNSINQYLVYRGVKYSFIVSPMNKDFNDSFVLLTASRQKTKSVQILEPIKATPFDIFTAYKNRVTVEGGVFEASQCTLNFMQTKLA